MPKKWYAVVKGRVPGIYTSWPDCVSQTHQYSGAIFKSFETEYEALQHLSSHATGHNTLTCNSPLPCNSHLGSPLSLPHISSATDIIYVDGGCNKHTGNDAWGRVCLYDGTDLLQTHLHLVTDLCVESKPLPRGPTLVIVCRFNDVAHQQNNGAELLALLVGLRIAVYSDAECKYTKVASDSSLLVNHWTDKLNDHRLVHMDPLKVAYIREAQELKKRFVLRGGSVIKISGDNNPADLGYH